MTEQWCDHPRSACVFTGCNCECADCMDAREKGFEELDEFDSSGVPDEYQNVPSA
jgi:hypothetical protein